MEFYLRRIVTEPYYQERIHQVLKNPSLIYDKKKAEIIKFGEKEMLEQEIKEEHLVLYTLPKDQKKIDRIYSERNITLLANN